MSYDAQSLMLGRYTGDVLPQMSLVGGSTPIASDYWKSEKSLELSLRPALQQPAVYGSPDDQVKYGITSTAPDPNYRIEEDRTAKNTTKPKNTDVNAADAGGSTPEKPKYTEDQVMFYGKSASYLVDAASDFANSLLAADAAGVKEKSYEFKAKQNERAARLLEKNIVDINRAAQLDSNVYKVQNKETKSKQKVAMAASGFAVGKGAYRSTLETTDARTNYNIAMRMLKADLQTAKTMRKAGEYRAQAEIERGNARVARIAAESAATTYAIKGIGKLINAGFSFYMGKWGLEGEVSTPSTAKSGGKQ